MDAYTKIVLTVIAVALVVIAVRLSPSPALADMSGGPTLGSLYNARQLTGEAQAEAMFEITQKVPLVAPFSEQ